MAHEMTEKMKRTEHDFRHRRVNPPVLLDLFETCGDNLSDSQERFTTTINSNKC